MLGCMAAQTPIAPKTGALDVRDARQQAARNAIGPLLDQFDLAALLDVSLETLRIWRQNGCGPPAIRISKRPYYRLNDLRSWIESLPAGEPFQSAKKPAERRIKTTK